MRGHSSGLRGRVLALAVAAAVALAAAGSGGAGPSPGSLRLQRDVSSLAARRHRALLDLYAAETQLAGARSRLTALRAQATQVRAEAQLARRAVAIAGRAHAISERRLAQQLKSLYEQEQVDPLVVVLGAHSLDEALTQIDALDRTARQSSAIARRAGATRIAYAHLSARLAERSRRLAALEAQAAASVDALVRARAQHAALVGSLQRQEALTRQQLAALETTARAAEAKTETLVSGGGDTGPSSGAPAAPAAGGSAPPPQPDPAPATGGRTLTVTATGYSLPGRTATGLPVGWGVVAVDPAVIPLGTHLSIPGYGGGVAADIGAGVRGATIDLWFPSTAQAVAWGRRTVTITLH